jgi:NSS family neurotransmitter:Na+ symporter
MNKHNKSRSSFSGKIGYVLAAAGASVGLGNIWRFPYLAAKYGGGIFLLIYILLALTFGYSMIVAESAIGRMTRKSPVGAFQSFGKSKWLSAGGWINAIIPILIVPYYSVIGGWVIKYLIEYVKGNSTLLAEDGYFSGFISNGVSTELCFAVFCLITVAIIYAGVRNGIERVSKVMMPILIVLSVIIAVYSVTRPGALAGVKYFLVPNLKNFSWMSVVAAMGQMFYSLSIAMGILITFGSYMKKDTSIEDSTRNVEIFDTAIAIMAGLMIIPAVFAFSGGTAVHARDFLVYGRQYAVVLVIGLLVSTPLPEKLWRRIRTSPLGTVLLLVLFWVCVYCMAVATNDPFMYFSF